MKIASVATDIGHTGLSSLAIEVGLSSEFKLSVTQYDDVAVVELDFPIDTDECGLQIAPVLDEPFTVLTSQYGLLSRGDGVVVRVCVRAIKNNSVARIGDRVIGYILTLPGDRLESAELVLSRGSAYGSSHYGS